MQAKKITILILLLAVIMVVSGCGEKEVKPVVNNNIKSTATTTEPEVHPEEIINYLENGEIDTSDWKIYENYRYNLKIKHPSFLKVDGYPEFDLANYKQFEFEHAINNIDKVWNFSCHYQPENSYLYEMSLSKRKKNVKESYLNRIDFDEFIFNDGIIYYGEDDATKKEINFPRYLISAMIVFNRDIVLYCVNDIDILHKEAIKDEIRENKYGKVIKAMLKTVESIN